MSNIHVRGPRIHNGAGCFAAVLAPADIVKGAELPSVDKALYLRNAEPGRFVLTGSQNFLLMESVSQSLAGRTGILNLLPLERAELEGESREAPVNPGTLFPNKHSDLDLWEKVFRGFYPRIHAEDQFHHFSPVFPS